MRKLVTDGFVEKAGKDPIIYSLTMKGAEFEIDNNLKEVYLKGEISNFKYSGRHCYFSLKDEKSEISAMFFYPIYKVYYAIF